MQVYVNYQRFTNEMPECSFHKFSNLNVFVFTNISTRSNTYHTIASLGGMLSLNGRLRL